MRRADVTTVSYQRSSGVTPREMNKKSIDNRRSRDTRARTCCRLSRPAKTDRPERKSRHCGRARERERERERMRRILCPAHIRESVGSNE